MDPLMKNRLCFPPEALGAFLVWALRRGRDITIYCPGVWSVSRGSDALQ